MLFCLLRSQKIEDAVPLTVRFQTCAAKIDDSLDWDFVCLPQAVAGTNQPECVLATV